MKKLFFVLLFIAIACNISSAQKKSSKKHRAKKVKTLPEKKGIKYGVASYYAQKFNGRRTANREIYSSEKYTAACNSLPLNTWVKVVNLKNNRSVIVKINDRLHAKNKRLIDLAKIAAKKLGYFGKGLTRVKIEVLHNYHS